jgi:hypothetical protein
MNICFLAYKNIIGEECRDALIISKLMIHVSAGMKFADMVVKEIIEEFEIR